MYNDKGIINGIISFSIPFLFFSKIYSSSIGENALLVVVDKRCFSQNSHDDDHTIFDHLSLRTVSKKLQDRFFDSKLYRMILTKCALWDLACGSCKAEKMRDEPIVNLTFYLDEIRKYHLLFFEKIYPRSNNSTKQSSFFPRRFREEFYNECIIVWSDKQSFSLEDNIKNFSITNKDCQKNDIIVPRGMVYVEDKEGLDFLSIIVQLKMRIDFENVKFIMLGFSFPDCLQEELLGADPDGSCIAKMVDINRNTFFMYACNKGYKQLFELLLQVPNDHSLLSLVDLGGESALNKVMATSESKREKYYFVKALVESGVFINGSSFYNPVYLALAQRHFKIAALLIKNGMRFDEVGRQELFALLFRDKKWRKYR